MQQVDSISGVAFEVVPFRMGPQVMAEPRRPSRIYQELRFDRPAIVRSSSVGLKSSSLICSSIEGQQAQVSELLLRLAQRSHTHSMYRDKPSTRQQLMGHFSANAWDAVLSDYKLMADAHYEDDAQLSHLIDTEQCFSKLFQISVPVEGVRIFIEQPSPNWRSFGLRDIK